MRKHSALLVVDMINDYAHPEGRDYCANSRLVLDNIVLARSYARREGIPIVYANSSVIPLSPMVRRWGLTAFKDSWGAQLITELCPLLENEIIFKKESYDAF
jgi:nicotinamidase-related amidase